MRPVDDRTGLVAQVSQVEHVVPEPSTDVEPPPAAPPQMDPVLHDIYSKETDGHLSVIREYLRKRTGQPAPHDLPENVYRAIHTLSGSSKMAEARHGIRITEPLHLYMRKVFRQRSWPE